MIYRRCLLYRSGTDWSSLSFILIYLEQTVQAACFQRSDFSGTMPFTSEPPLVAVASETSEAGVCHLSRRCARVGWLHLGLSRPNSLVVVQNRYSLQPNPTVPIFVRCSDSSVRSPQPSIRFFALFLVDGWWLDTVWRTAGLDPISTEKKNTCNSQRTCFCWLVLRTTSAQGGEMSGKSAFTSATHVPGLKRTPNCREQCTRDFEGRPLHLHT